MRRPRLQRSLELFPASTGDIYVLRGGTNSDLAVEGTPDARRLLELLDGSRSREELVATVCAQSTAAGPEDVDEALGQLEACGVLEDASDDDLLPPDVRVGFDRQLRYFRDVAPGRSAARAQQRLEASTVAVIGVGGLGCWTALSLASAGIGRLVLIDGDEVEESNLHRQVLYRRSDLDRPKATTAAASLRAWYPGTESVPAVARLESASDVRTVVARADCVVQAADWPAHRIDGWVNDVCFELGIPFLALSQVPPLARLGPLYLPGTTGCYRCEERRWRADFPLFDELVRWRGETTSPAGALGPGCALLGAAAAGEIVHALTGICRPGTLGRAMIVDLRDWRVTTRTVERDGRCSVCSPGGARPG